MEGALLLCCVAAAATGSGAPSACELRASQAGRQAGRLAFAFNSSSCVACRTTPFSMMVAASSVHTCEGRSIHQLNQSINCILNPRWGASRERGQGGSCVGTRGTGTACRLGSGAGRSALLHTSSVHTRARVVELNSAGQCAGWQRVRTRRGKHAARTRPPHMLDIPHPHAAAVFPRNIRLSAAPRLPALTPALPRHKPTNAAPCRLPTCGLPPSPTHPSLALSYASSSDSWLFTRSTPSEAAPWMGLMTAGNPT